MRQRRQEREADDEGADEELGKKRVRFVNDEEEVLNSEDEFQEGGSDSDEILYDSEEEDAAEREFEERKDKKLKNTMGKQMIDTGDEDSKKQSFYDIEAEVKKVQKFKPAEGVKFKQFDALGLPTDDGFDYYKYITTDTNQLDTVLEASPDQMEAVYHPKGERFDRDKDENEMNDEGKAFGAFYYTIVQV